MKTALVRALELCPVQNPAANVPCREGSQTDAGNFEPDAIRSGTETNLEVMLERFGSKTIRFSTFVAWVRQL